MCLGIMDRQDLLWGGVGTVIDVEGQKMRGQSAACFLSGT